MRNNFTRPNDDEMLVLIRAWREEGDKSAYDRLVESQLAWAENRARHFCLRTGWNDVDEAISASYEGAMEAVKRFDPTKAGRLSTYVHWWVFNKVMRAYGRRHVIHVPARASEYGYQEEAARAASALSLDQMERQDTEWGTYQIPADRRPAKNEKLKLRVLAALSRLPKREQLVIQKLVIDGGSPLDAAEDMGISRAQIRRIKDRAMRKLEHWVRDGDGET